MSQKEEGFKEESELKRESSCCLTYHVKTSSSSQKVLPKEQCFPVTGERTIVLAVLSRCEIDLLRKLSARALCPMVNLSFQG